MKLRKAFLWAVLISLAAAAALGIQGLLLDRFSDRWIETMLSIFLFSVTSLGDAIVIERGRWRLPLFLAISLGALALVLMLSGIWSRHYDETVAKLTAIAVTWSIALPVAGLTILPKFTGIWSLFRLLTTAQTLAAAATLTIAIHVEPHDDITWRLIAVQYILAILCILSIPILWKMRGIEKLENIETSPLELRITCPRCLLEQTVPSGRSRCSRCRLRFNLEIEEPRCPECNYLLYRLTSPRCPECGHALAPEEVESSPPATPATPA